MKIIDSKKDYNEAEIGGIVMETKFNFNSQICTTREQSERLIALGLKKETADMMYKPHYINGILKNYFKPTVLEKNVLEYMLMDEAFKDYIPAWSLHRLLSMLPYDVPKIDWVLDGASIAIEFEDSYTNSFLHKGDIYERVINSIEWLIKEEYFKKEYLV